MFDEIVSNKYKYVFFDIFDTILSRKVQPEFSKKIWCNHIIKTFQLNINMKDLYKKRNEIEFELGNNNSNKGFDNEFQYEAMVKSLYKYIKIDNIDYNYFYEICEQEEINIESKLLYLNEDMLELIKDLKKNNKKIYCISDMYLSKKMIKQIFTNLNIDNYFNDYYISCEYLKNKKTGNLYDIALKDLSIKPEESVMVGDNQYSDFEIPNSKKIKSILLDRKEKYQFYSSFQDIMEKINYEKELNNISRVNGDNFEHCIFSLYDFIEKLYFNLLKEKKDEVFFLSREGEYLKKLFDYYVEKVDNKKIKSHYLLVSRKSTYLPSLKPLESENFDSLLKQYSFISIKDFLKSLNLSKKEINDISIEYQKNIKKLKDELRITKFDKKKFKTIIANNIEQKIPFIKNSTTIQFLKSNIAFKKIYEENRIKQHKNFIKYITDKTSSKNIALVDIGWNGSIQNNIQKILGKEYIIEGYYFGLQRKNQKEKTKKTGLIFTNVPDESANYSLYNENRAIFEIILGASHGSANKYELIDNKIQVNLFEKKEEQDIFLNSIKPVQDRMYETYKELVELLVNGYYNNIVLNKKINMIHFNMVCNPTKEQVNFFNKMHHFENFGVFTFTKFSKKNKISIKRFIKENAKCILRHTTYFDDCHWPVLKMINNKLYIQYCIYKIHRKNKLRKANII